MQQCKNNNQVTIIKYIGTWQGVAQHLSVGRPSSPISHSFSTLKSSVGHQKYLPATTLSGRRGDDVRGDVREEEEKSGGVERKVRQKRAEGEGCEGCGIERC